MPVDQQYRRGFRILWNNYTRRSRDRNTFWGLSEEQFFKLTQGHCTYCGIEPKQRVWNVNPARTFLYNGIDRKDNAKGYTPENCLPACGFCNALKSDLLQHEEMKVVIQALLHFRKKKKGRKNPK